MAKLQSTLPNMLLSLTAICLVAGAVLAGVYEVTKDPIEAAKIAELNAAKLQHRFGDSFSIEDSRDRHEKEKEFKNTEAYKELVSKLFLED